MSFPARHAVVCLLAVLVAACDPFPRDPHETTRMIEDSGKLRVGVIHDPPWADTSSHPPRGREIELVNAFARRLDAAPEWHYLGTHDGFKALEHGDIDMLIGGLVNASPYKKKAGFTRPYEKTRGRFEKKHKQHVLAVRRGENRFLLKLDNYLKQEFPQYPGGSP